MGVLKAFSSEVHAVNSNGNYFDASKSTLNKMNIYKTLIAMLASQKLKMEANMMQAEIQLKTLYIIKAL